MTKLKYGDLIVKCHQCGGTQLREPLITDGRAIYLFNHDDSYLMLSCPDCNISMEMRIVPNDKANAELEDKIEDAEIVEINEELPKEGPDAKTV